MLDRFFRCCCYLSVMVCISGNSDAVWGQEPSSAETATSLSVSQCIEIAMTRNRKRLISKLAVDTAEYQYNQALSAFWPQVKAEVAYHQQDEDVNFIFPENKYVYQMTVPGLGNIEGQTTVPEQDITVMERESLLSSLNLTYPLFTGGLRPAALKAAKSNIQMAKQAMRRTELELIRDVQRMYYGTVLAQRLADIGEQTLARFETTTELTERFYKKGAGSVTKLDYLRSKMVQETARSIVKRLTSNVPLSLAALGNTMGLEWDTPISLSENEIPYVEVDTNLKEMVAGAYQFNPDWKQMAAGLVAAQASIQKQRAGHWPKVVLKGSLWRWDNNLDNLGLATKQNEDGWRVGVGMQLPIFTGFFTSSKIKEARVRLKKLKSQQILLKEGLALQIKHGVIRLDRSQGIRNASLSAAEYAQQHRELAVKAYMNELISTEVVIESQVFEALARAKFEAAQYESALARFNIDVIVGKEVQKLLGVDH